MTLTTTLHLQLIADLVNALDLVNAQARQSTVKDITLADGSGVNQASKLFSDKRTLIASASEDLDLAGALTDPLGAALTLTKVKLLLITADPGNANDVVVGGAAANAFATPFGDATDKLKIKPGGILLLVAPNAGGYAVTAGTGDVLTVANGGAGSSVTYSITVIGA
jgi:hypothetical protein